MAEKLLVIAGPNGSGKSTLYKYLVSRYKAFKNIVLINPDVIAEDIKLESNIASSIQAGKIAIKMRNRFLKEKKTFAIETTLSGHSEIDLIYRAYKQGYDVYIIYVALDDPFLNVQRVKSRVISGGHNVLPNDIIRRYDRSLKNLKKIIPISSTIYIFDNSFESFRLILSYRFKGARGNKSLIINRDTPKWADDILKFIKNRVSN